MQVLSERLCQTIRQRFDHDRAVVVVLGLESRRELVHAKAGRNRERADMVLGRTDKVGKREIWLVVAVVDLLAQHRKARAVLEDDVVALGGRGPETVDAFGPQPVVGLDLVEHLLGVPKQLARDRAVRRALQDGGELSLQLPGVEEKGPVDVLAQLRDPGFDDLCAYEGRRGQVVESELQPLRARIHEREQGAPRGGVLSSEPLLERLVVAVEHVTAVLVKEV